MAGLEERVQLSLTGRALGRGTSASHYLKDGLSLDVMREAIKKVKPFG